MTFGGKGLYNIMTVKQFTKFFGGVLSAAVRMEQQTGRLSAGSPCGLKHVDGELDVHFGTDPVSNHLSCKQINNNAEIVKSAAGSDVSDIADPLGSCIDFIRRYTHPVLMDMPYSLAS